MKTNIALIGARGAGKSKLSRYLKKLCGWPVMSIDTLLSYENNGLPIVQIVAQVGWPGFRQLEYKILKKLSQMQNIIVDCGGGIVVETAMKSKSKRDSTAEIARLEPVESYSKCKVELLKKHCHVVFLKRSESWLLRKNLPSAERPALSGNYRKLLKKRQGFYKQAADLSLNMDKYSIEKAAEILYKKYFS